MSTRRIKVERYFIAKDPAMGTKTVMEYISNKKKNCDGVKRLYDKMIKNGQGAEIVGKPYKVYAYKNGYEFTIPEDGEYFIIPFIDYLDSRLSIIYNPTFTMKL